jgi:hypothetical protein
MHMLVRGAPGTPLSRPDLHDPAKWWIRPGDGDSFFA